MRPEDARGAGVKYIGPTMMKKIYAGMDRIEKGAVLSTEPFINCKKGRPAQILTIHPVVKAPPLQRARNQLRSPRKQIRHQRLSKKEKLQIPL